MNWVQENKFLAVFVAVMVVAIGFLGFKVFSASGALEEANAAYDTKAAAYNRLRRLEPFPNRAHLAAFEAQKTEAAEAINAFQEELAKKEFPAEAMSPTQFQDELKKSVTDIRAKAIAAGVKLPDKFYLGFDRYETAPPDKDIAAALGRQLKAIEWVLAQFIAVRIAELKDLKRPEMAEEKKGGATGGSRPAERGARSGTDRGGDRGGRSARADLVSNLPFDIVVVARQRQFADVLNLVISPKAPQFYIPRAVRIANTNPKAPPRVVETPPPTPIDPAAPTEANPGVPAAPAPSVAAAPPVATAASDINYIVGEEMIEAGLRLEIVDFAEVAKK